MLFVGFEFTGMRLSVQRGEEEKTNTKTELEAQHGSLDHSSEIQKTLMGVYLSLVEFIPFFFLLCAFISEFFCLTNIMYIYIFHYHKIQI